MNKADPIKYVIPQSSQPFRMSRAALGLLAATCILAVILIYSTYENINRAQILMESFLSDKGETVIRSIEASSRASVLMLHHMGEVDPLHTLLTENCKEEDIVFITIYNEDGSVFDHAGTSLQNAKVKQKIEDQVRAKKTTPIIHREGGVFIITEPFTLSNSILRLHQLLTTGQQEPQLPRGATNLKLITVGLRTDEFDIARKQDVRHTLFMGTILFLVGLAGLYFLFLYQKMRMTSATLADMKLYTDSVLESIPVSLITLDAGDKIVSCNQNTREIFGTPLDSLAGKPIEEALPNCSGSLTDLCSCSNEQTLDYQIADGRNLPLHVSCSALVNYDNKTIGKVLIIRDMSSIRQMEIQLERSRRMAALGKMAAGIAHEIRNPLGTLRGFAQFFGNRPNSGEDEKQYSSLMISEIDRLNHTISGLLQFSRPREPQLQDFPLSELIKKTTVLMKSDFSNHKVLLKAECDADLLIHGDPDLLLQVLMNLLKNSINATDPGGKISIACRQEQNVARITVADDGCGMSETERDKMFDPFFSTTKTGTGLGLAVSHQIVEQHHGTFEVHTQKNRGTEITVVLPNPNFS